MRKKIKDPWANYVPAPHPLTLRQEIVQGFIFLFGATLICGALIELCNYTGLVNYF